VLFIEDTNEINVLGKKEISQNIFEIKTTKPKNFNYHSGQAVFIEYKNLKKPFTMTSIPKEKFLNFTIKIYDNHNGFTKNLRDLNINDKLIISNPFGSINYKGEGIFIAGGTGVTPFLSIFKDIDEKNSVSNNTKDNTENNIHKLKSKLIYSSKYENEIIKREYLIERFQENYEEIITSKEKRIKKNLNNNYYYVCGPNLFTQTIIKTLKELGIDDNRIIK